MPQFPAARLLVPAEPPVLPDGFGTVRAAILNGLPHFVDLDRDLRLKFTFPTGLLGPWLDRAPDALVASAADERAPREAEPKEEVGGTSRPPLRFAASRAGVVQATVPFALSARRTLPDGGDAAHGAMLELILLDWAIHAGTVRGPGDFGSFVGFAWRYADRAVDAFGPPVINPFLMRRLPPTLRTESDLGLIRVKTLVRLRQRRLAIRELL